VDPVPYLISCAFASNIGGTATLIGDPPNIMIASKAQLNFMDFIYHLAPVIVVTMVAYIVMIKLIWGRKLATRDELKIRIMQMDERAAIKDPVMLTKSLVVLGIVLTGFVFHGVLHYQPATVALFGAGLLLLLSKTHEPHHILAEIEWPTIFFFMGLFIIVGGVVKVGLIKWMSLKILALTEGNLLTTSMVVMWFSAFASAIVDNIPYVATMNPLIADMASQLWPGLSGVQLLQHPDLMPLWWSLALGACLGGNGSAIGASANVIVVGMSEKAGRKISFMKFMAYGMPVMIMTVVLSTVYVWLRYYVFRI
jgi:Na+/H+ antiporter NhaD/arsenite permease-like protein